jgi:hypothetical protein
MENETTTQDLRERLDLIENMMAEGRRTCESWGWTFVLWGVAYFVAFFWNTWGHYAYAWPLTVVVAALLTALGFWRRSGGDRRPNTTLGRSIVAVWWTMGAAMFILFDALGFGGHLTDYHVSIAVAGAMLGATNAACAFMLRWRAQFFCAVVWWAACVISAFGSDTQAVVAFLAAIFLCQIVFGTYMMILESRRSRRQGAVHV